MIYLIYGEDTFLAKEKLAAVREKYRSVCGDINLIEINGEEASWQTLQSQMLAMPFLANKRLVIIKFISKAASDVREKLANWLEKIPDSTVIFIYEEKLDRRMIIFQKLLKNFKNCQEFPLLDPIKLKKWIIKRVASENLIINKLAVDKLAEMYGPNLWVLSSEIAKMVSYKIGLAAAQKQELDEISLNDIELLSSSLAEVNVFHLIDSLRNRELGASLKLLDELSLAGEDELRLLGLIVSQFRNLIEIFDLKKLQPNLSAYQIAAKISAKPFVVTKALSGLKNASSDWLKYVYQSLVDIDYQIKTGQIDASLALDLLAIKVCGSLNNR